MDKFRYNVVLLREEDKPNLAGKTLFDVEETHQDNIFIFYVFGLAVQEDTRNKDLANLRKEIGNGQYLDTNFNGIKEALPSSFDTIVIFHFLETENQVKMYAKTSSQTIIVTRKNKPELEYLNIETGTSKISIESLDTIKSIAAIKKGSLGKFKKNYSTNTDLYNTIFQDVKDKQFECGNTFVLKPILPTRSEAIPTLPTVEPTVITPEATPTPWLRYALTGLALVVVVVLAYKNISFPKETTPSVILLKKPDTPVVVPQPLPTPPKHDTPTVTPTPVVTPPTPTEVEQTAQKTVENAQQVVEKGVNASNLKTAKKLREELQKQQNNTTNPELKRQMKDKLEKIDKQIKVWDSDVYQDKPKETKPQNNKKINPDEIHF